MPVQHVVGAYQAGQRTRHFRGVEDIIDVGCPIEQVTARVAVALDHSREAVVRVLVKGLGQVFRFQDQITVDDEVLHGLVVEQVRTHLTWSPFS